MKILWLAREKRELRFKDNRVHLFPDFSEAVQSKRRAFLLVKQKLQKLRIRYAVIFPAILSIEHDGIQSRFYSPEEAEIYVNRIQVSEPASPTI